MTIRLSRRTLIQTGVMAALLVRLPAWATSGDLQVQPAERLDHDLVRLTWSGTGRPVSIGLLRAPDQMRPEKWLARGARGQEFQTRMTGPARPYFRVEDGETSVVTAERILPLQGGRNFRDLGGYPTADGRRVQWGRLYRSGTMTHLTDADFDYLARLGVRVICDLRTTRERELEPNHWKDAARIEYWSRDYQDSMGAVADMLRDGSATAERVRGWLTDYYRRMPYLHAESYAEMFRRLSAGQIPLAFNCSAGKDRTGVASALVLSVLGVPRETVMADYALTEKFQHYTAKDMADPKNPYPFLARLPHDVLAALMRADPAYLQASFDGIDQRSGSLDAYLQDELGVSATDRAKLRAALLV